MNRSQDADKAGSNASSDVRRARALMECIKQKAIEHIVYPIALWADPGTFPIRSKNEGNEDGARVCLVGISAVGGWYTTEHFQILCAVQY